MSSTTTASRCPELLRGLLGVGAPLEVLSHGGMPVVVEHYPEVEEVDRTVVPLREGHHGHPA